jgi:hypothetical protein
MFFLEGEVSAYDVYGELVGEWLNVLLNIISHLGYSCGQVCGGYFPCLILEDWLVYEEVLVTFRDVQVDQFFFDTFKFSLVKISFRESVMFGDRMRLAGM